MRSGTRSVVGNEQKWAPVKSSQGWLFAPSHAARNERAASLRGWSLTHECLRCGWSLRGWLLTEPLHRDLLEISVAGSLVAQPFRKRTESLDSNEVASTHSHSFGRAGPGAGPGAGTSRGKFCLKCEACWSLHGWLVAQPLGMKTLENQRRRVAGRSTLA